MRPGDRFGAGSIVKPFVAATVLQLVEGGSFTLDAALPDVLPADVTDRFPGASERGYRWVADRRSAFGRLLPASVKRWADRVISESRPRDR